MPIEKQNYFESQTDFKVSGLTFGVLNPTEIRKLSHINVLTNNLYEATTRKPAEYGVLDLRLGSNIKGTNCGTCGESWADCPGHFGYIDLVMPCFHVGFFRSIINILQCVCKDCSKVLLPDDVKEKELVKVNKPSMTYLEKKAVRKVILTKCKKISRCPHCGSYNGFVKKCAALKIVHAKFQHGKKVGEKNVAEYTRDFENVLCTSKDLGVLLQKTQEILNPQRVQEIFRKIPTSELSLLMMDQYCGHPRDLILTRILVPPSCIRPSVVSAVRAGTTEDDLTMRLLEIILANNLSLTPQNSGGRFNFMDQWDFLQQQVALLINSEQTGFPKYPGEVKKPQLGVVQRLKGKKGRFRCNLSGKRVIFSARTVISPEPHLGIDEIGIPLHMAKVLTFPERVNERNYDRMRQLVLNGQKEYPGATSVVKKDSNMKFHILHSIRKKMSQELKIGDTVERNAVDGDIVIFNRQPSLHRVSIQAFRIKVTKFRTLQFNECCCPPFNADFDGDEMNIHFPQTEEAKAEAAILLDSKSNIITPRNGEPLIGAIQDFITGAYLLTQKDNFFNKTQLLQMFETINDKPVDIPLPAILKPVPLWTGKQIFSIIIKPNKSNKVLLSLRVPAKQVLGSNWEYSCPSCKAELLRKKADRYASSTNCRTCVGRFAMEMERGRAVDPLQILCRICCLSYTQLSEDVTHDLCPGCVHFNKTCKQDELDPKDNFVVIHNSELLAGYIEKGTVGSGSKSSIFYLMLRDYGKQFAADAMLRLSKLSSLYLMGHGFSIGLSDVTISQNLSKKKQDLLEEGHKKCGDFIQQFNTKKLKASPGCTQEQTLENTMLKTLSNIRDQAGNACLQELPMDNSPLTMVLAGSKGSVINIAQMVACVGQQSVSGKRVPNGFRNRTLAANAKNSKDAASKGFVANSFYTGLLPRENHFHAVAGREGIVDTAVKTAETGYMQRRLMKAMEDLGCAYDGTVRNSTGAVVQFAYGSDGLDPMAMEAKYKKSKNSKLTKEDGIRPIDFARVLDQTCRAQTCRDEEPLKSEEVMEIYSRLLDLPQYKFMRSHKLSKMDDATTQPERARNFGRHMRKFIDSLVANLNTGRVSADSICRHSRITRTQLKDFLSTCYNKFMSAQMEPGTAVGAIAAQSIGEPGTQMTLKTFHFAGVASMNITQGVPRILEIINATKRISTPVAKCPLENSFDENVARTVKGRIERTTLGQISNVSVISLNATELAAIIKLDLKRIEILKLEIDIFTVKRAIVASKLKVDDQNIEIMSKSEIIIRPTKSSKVNILWVLYHLKVGLPKVLISGIPTVKRVVVQTKEGGKDGKTEYELIVEGTNLQAVMSTIGVDGRKVESNNIMEIKSTLGIEAARRSIINEMSTSMESHGITLDKRHVMLLADTMTYMGDAMGINRGGMARMRESTLMLASFEKTADHLFEAAYHGQMDSILGVSERIITGVPMNLGTGMFTILQKEKQYQDDLKRRTYIGSREFHLPDPLIEAAQGMKGMDCEPSTTTAQDE